MADNLDQLNLNQAGTLPPELYAQQQQLNRQQQMAAMLMQQGQQQPQGQMISGRYVAPSFFQQLQAPTGMLLGAYMAKQGDTKAADLAQALREGRETEKQAGIEAIKKGDITGALALPNTYGGMNQLTPSLVKAAIPELSSEEKLYQRAKAEGYPGNIMQFIDQQNRSKANNTVINMGQHGFENTLKLGENFKNEPIYKAHQEVKQAYKQINSALDMNNATGDLAAATKVAKILDPGSIVHESELATVANAKGTVDKLATYTNKITNGQFLDANQRKDFRRLANDFYTISGEQYNEARTKYSDIGKQNQLSGVETMLGPQWKTATPINSVPLTNNMQNANKILGIPPIGGNNGR